MRPNHNNLIIIDCWEHLNHALEHNAKCKLNKFLSRIEGCPDWNVYAHSGRHVMDPMISMQLQNGNFYVDLHCDNPYECFNTDHVRDFTKYFFCGFHANMCIFYKPIGIENYWQLADQQTSDFNILSDLTAGIAIENHVERVCPTLDIPFMTAKDWIESEVQKFNYRNQTIKMHAILSTEVNTLQDQIHDISSACG